MNSCDSVGSDPTLAPPLKFCCLALKVCPLWLHLQPGIRAIRPYQNHVRHMHPHLPGFIGYSKAILGFGPATADTSHNHITTTTQLTYLLQDRKPQWCLACAPLDQGGGVTNGSGLGLWGPRADKSGPRMQRNNRLLNSLDRGHTLPG